MTALGGVQRLAGTFIRAVTSNTSADDDSNFDDNNNASEHTHTSDSDSDSDSNIDNDVQVVSDDDSGDSNGANENKNDSDSETDDDYDENGHEGQRDHDVDGLGTILSDQNAGYTCTEDAHDHDEISDDDADTNETDNNNYDDNTSRQHCQGRKTLKVDHEAAHRVTHIVHDKRASMLKHEIEEAFKYATRTGATHDPTSEEYAVDTLSGFVELLWEPIVEWTMASARATRDWLVSDQRLDIANDKKEKLKKLHINEELVWSYFAVNTAAGASQM